MADYRRILLIKPSSLGDIVHALPTLACLRDRFPRARIAWLVKRQWAELVERAEGLDEVWPVEPGFSGWAAIVPRIRAAGFDLVLDLQGLLRSGVIAWLSGCPLRVGFANGREGSPFFYTHRVPVPTPDMHAVDRYRLVARALGTGAASTQDSMPAPQFKLRPFPADEKTVTELLGRHGLNPGDPWIAVSVSARWPTKRWPPEFFAEVLNRIYEASLGTPILIGAPDEQEVAQAVKTQVRHDLPDLIGATTPGLLPALLASARLLLTNDSGPMHVAAAVGTPVVALFGPTSPLRTGPYGAGHQVLRHQVPCSPCFSRVCRNQVPLECLVGISPQTVYETVRGQVLLQSGSRPNSLQAHLGGPRL